MGSCLMTEEFPPKNITVVDAAGYPIEVDLSSILSHPIIEGWLNEVYADGHEEGWEVGYRHALGEEE